MIDGQARDGVVGRVDDDGDAVEGDLEFVVGDTGFRAGGGLFVPDPAPAGGEVGLTVAEALEARSTASPLDLDVDSGRLGGKRLGGCFQDRADGGGASHDDRPSRGRCTGFSLRRNRRDKRRGGQGQDRRR